MIFLSLLKIFFRKLRVVLEFFDPPQGWFERSFENLYFKVIVPYNNTYILKCFLLLDMFQFFTIFKSKDSFTEKISRLEKWEI